MHAAAVVAQQIDRRAVDRDVEGRGGIRRPQADTSLRESAILGFGTGPDADLDPDWKRVVMDFQDRLMIGSDTWVNGQWDRYADIMTSNCRWLAKLPRDVAEKIAYRNAEALFGRKVTMDLVGTK